MSSEVGVELTVRIHHEDGAYWAEVLEHPGCFAAGDTQEELLESLREGLSLVLDCEVPSLELGGRVDEPETEERKLVLA